MLEHLPPLNRSRIMFKLLAPEQFFSRILRRGVCAWEAYRTPTSHVHLATTPVSSPLH